LGSLLLRIVDLKIRVPISAKERITDPVLPEATRAPAAAQA
jgi:hypothetical protein